MNLLYEVESNLDPLADDEVKGKIQLPVMDSVIEFILVESKSESIDDLLKRYKKPVTVNYLHRVDMFHLSHHYDY